jgi:hypothetical protein
MPMTFARLLDPSFEDDDDPFRHYDVRGLLRLAISTSC